MATGGGERWIRSNPQVAGTPMPEWKKELIQRRKNLAKCMTTGHSHSQQCHGTAAAANSTQIHRQVARIGGQARSSGSTVGECRATVQSCGERDGVRVSHVASNGLSSSTSNQCEDKLCEQCDTCETRDILCEKIDGYKMVAVQEMCGEKMDYDTSEELKYGAGIVSKLVSRFMSYTMRVSAAKERPSLENMRRATSLNNLLDDDTDVVVQPQEHHRVIVDEEPPKVLHAEEIMVQCDKGVYRHRQPQQHQQSEIMRRRQMVRGNDSLKRARSVDALLRVDGQGDKDVAPEVIEEESNGIATTQICDVTIEDKIMNARERGEAKPKRLKSFMDDPERPPPDLVKTTLRIFEATANRRGRPPTCRSGDVAAKVASFKTIMSQEKPAILYPKPPVSPKKGLMGKNVRPSSHTTTVVTAKPATVVEVVQPPPKATIIQRSPSPLSIRMDMTYRSVKTFSPTSPQSPKPDLLNVSPPRRQQQPENGGEAIAQLTNKIQSIKIEQVSNVTRNVPLRSGTVSSTTEESDTDTTDSFDDDEGSIKRISKGDLDNISRAGATTEFNFGGCTSTPIRDKSHLPPLTNGAGNLTIQLVEHIDASVVVDDGESVVDVVNGGCKVEKSPENGVQEKQIVVTEMCSEKQLTNQEIEKNMINREKSEATQMVVSPKWVSSKKKPWQEEPQNTTMVFNFSNRKDVPDYIENDGVVLRRRREMPKPGESGFVLLGDAPLETSTDPDDWTMGPPSPCDVDFENDNVIINGKSSLRHKLGDSKQWKIRFDDSLTSTYEYPSETSQREEMLNVTSNGKSGLMDDKSFNSSAYQKFLPLGLTPLANYTPAKGGGITSDFELGMKRNSPVVESPGSATGGCEQQQVNGGGDLDSLQYLKPATDEQTVAWSEGTRVTDLLF